MTRKTARRRRGAAGETVFCRRDLEERGKEGEREKEGERKREGEG